MRIFAFVVIAAAVVACDGTPAEPTPAADGLAILLGDDADVERRTGDSAGATRGAMFDRLNAQIVGFAGVYRVERCSVVVVLTEGASAGEAARTVNAVIAPRVEQSCPAGIRVAAERGVYTYTQLHRIHGVALPMVGRPGVLGARVSYRHNAVLIAVAERGTARRVLAELTSRGVPGGAVEFRRRLADGQ